MRIQSIGSVFNGNSVAKSGTQQSFKGLVGPIKKSTEQSEDSQCGGEIENTTVVNKETLTYYRFTDDSPSELSALKKKYEYSKLTDKNSSDTGYIVQCYYEYAEGEVNVINVPITYKTYNDYARNALLPGEKKKVESKLKKANLDVLIKKPEYTMQDAMKQAIQEEKAKKLAALRANAQRIFNEHESRKVVLKNASEVL